MNAISGDIRDPEVRKKINEASNKGPSVLTYYETATLEPWEVLLIGECFFCGKLACNALEQYLQHLHSKN